MTTAPRPPVSVVHLLWRLSQGGGVQTVVRQLVENLDPEQFHAHLISVRPAFDDDRLAELPVTVHSLGYRGPPWSLRARLTLGARAAGLVRRSEGALLHVHTGTPWLWAPAWLLGGRPPVVVEVHDAPGSGRHGRLTDLVEGMAARRAKAMVLTHSRSVEQAVAAKWRIGGGRVRRVPLAVDTNRIAPRSQSDRGAWRAQHGIAPDATVLIGIGRFVPSKRFELAVHALAALLPEHPDAVLVLVGAGPTEPDLRAAAGAAGLTDAVVFTGPRYGDELAAALGAADILCSTSAYEGFGLTLVEGMAAGLPVVAVAVGGVTDIVVDGSDGHLVPPGDPDAFIAALDGLLSEPSRARAFGRAARDHAVERFSVRSLVDAVERLYREIIGTDQTLTGRP